MQKLRPSGYNVLIKPFADDRMYESIIHLPDTAITRASDGIVIACGEWVDPAQLKPGDWVGFSHRQVVDVLHDNQPHFMVPFQACLVVIEDDEANVVS